MNIGYTRISTIDQADFLQKDNLTQAGCERIFSDHASGAIADRPGLAGALAFARHSLVIVALL